MNFVFVDSIHYIYNQPLRDHSENIIGGGVEAFQFSTAKSGHTLSEYWQNLGAPSPRIGRILVPPYI